MNIKKCPRCQMGHLTDSHSKEIGNNTEFYSTCDFCQHICKDAHVAMSGETFTRLMETMDNAPTPRAALNKLMERTPMFVVQCDPRERKGSWAPGSYSSFCYVCNKEFTGDKRACCCAPCEYGDEVE